MGYIYNKPDGMPTQQRHLSGLSRRSKLAKLGMRIEIAVVLSDLTRLLKWKSETVKILNH